MFFVLQKVANYRYRCHSRLIHLSRLSRLSCHASLLSGLVAIAGLSINTAFATSLAHNQSVFHQTLLAQRYQAYVNVGGYYFKKSSHKRGELSLFLPLHQDPYHLFYSDVRFYDHQGPGWEGNIALGYRHLSHDNDQLWGVYGTFDRMRSRDKNDFNQVTVGGEYWYNRWFMGGNVYVPIGKRTYNDQAAQGISLRQAGAYKHIYMGNGFERSLHGVDVQVGNNLWRGLTVYAGGYYYKAAHVPTVWGPRVRAEYTWYQSSTHPLLGIINRISVQTQLQEDKARGFNWYGGLLLSMNLLPSHHSVLSGVSRHMVDELHRDKDIVTSSFHDPLTLLRNSHGRALNIKDVKTKAGFKAALKDKKADVIAVHGDIKGLSNEKLSRKMVVTGGNYNFDHAGQHFNVALSKGGVLQAAKGSDLLELAREKGAKKYDIVLRDLTLRVDANSGHRVIFNDPKSGSIGNLRVDNINANGRVAIVLTGSKTTGRLSIVHSHFDTGKWSTGNDDAALFFKVDKGAHLIIDRLSNNRIKTSGDRVSGIYNLSEDGSSMLIHKLTGNKIFVKGDNTGGIKNLILNLASVTPTQLSIESLSDNIIDTKGDNSLGIANEVSSGHLKINNLNSNTITTSGKFSKGVFTSDDSGNVEIVDFKDNNIFVRGNLNIGVLNNITNMNPRVTKLHITIMDFSNNHVSVAGNNTAGIDSKAHGNNSKLIIYKFNHNDIQIKGSDIKGGIENSAYGGSKLVIRNFFGNHFDNYHANNIVLNAAIKGHITITVGDGNKGLSAANSAGDKNAGVQEQGNKDNIDIIPGP